MKKILIAEDEMDMAEIMKERLSMAGFDVVLAYDGYQGVQMAHKEKPDLMILDIMMPAGDGLSVLKRLRMSEDTKDMPIIVLTATRKEEYKKKAFEMGVFDFMYKPCDSALLINKINEALSGK
ncbi:response regulator transcription factor [Candidatus Auribacterota bacterium]